MNTDIPQNSENVIVDTNWVEECHTITCREKSFTIHNAPRILSLIHGKLIPNTNTVLILTPVEIIDSSACGCLLHLHRLCKSMNCQLAIVCKDNVSTILTRLHFQRLMLIFPQLTDATKSLKQSQVSMTKSK